MKAKELMIGDLVIATLDICEGDWDNEVTYRIPCKVEGVTINNDLGEGWNWEVCPIKSEDMMKFDRFDDIDPIPLTTEILEKNGFKTETFLSDEWDCEVYFREFPGCVVEPDDAGYTFGTIRYWHKQANDGSPEDWGTMYESRIKGLHYVHELQHALRLCGLNELADNFKV